MPLHSSAPERPFVDVLADLFPGKVKLQAARNTPIVLPIADDEQVRRSRRRSQARQRSRRGRASTIFTQGEGLGG